MISPGLIDGFLILITNRATKAHEWSNNQKSKENYSKFDSSCRGSKPRKRYAYHCDKTLVRDIQCTSTTLHNLQTILHWVSFSLEPWIHSHVHLYVYRIKHPLSFFKKKIWKQENLHRVIELSEPLVVHVAGIYFSCSLRSHFRYIVRNSRNCIFIHV